MCDKTKIYCTPKSSKGSKTLDKVTTVEIYKAFGINFGKYLAIEKADLVSRKNLTGEVNAVFFYEFDLAVAPTKYMKSSDNFGMGFCPYTNISK